MRSHIGSGCTVPERSSQEKPELKIPVRNGRIVTKLRHQLGFHLNLKKFVRNGHRWCQVDGWHGIEGGVEVSFDLPSSKADRGQLGPATSRGPEEIFCLHAPGFQEKKGHITRWLPRPPGARFDEHGGWRLRWRVSVPFGARLAGQFEL